MPADINLRLLSLPLSILVLGISVLAVIHVLLRARNPQSSLGWVLVIIFVPLLGSLAYFVFGLNRVDSRAARLMGDALITRREKLKGQDWLAGQDFPELRFDPAAHDIMRIGTGKTGSSRLVGGNLIEPLINGDRAFPAMLEAIDAARHEVFLCTYMFQGEVWGGAFAQAMLRARERGVDVRVLIDGIGSYKLDRPWKILRRAGIPVQRFLPPSLLPPQLSINLRMHRKVLICDGTGFTGGINIADFCVLDKISKKSTQDLHFYCRGPIVGALRETFLMDWAFVTEETQTSQPIFPGVHGNMDCRIVMDGTGSNYDPLEELFCGVISCAKSKIILFTPYFLPPKELACSLFSAASRGVDISVVLPEQSDHVFVDWASEHSQLNILEHGIAIYKQPPPFAHTKLMLIDDLYTCLGSTNLDPRSLNLNFELNMEVFSPELNAALTDYAAKIIARSHKVGLSELRDKPLGIRLRNASTWIFTPYL